MLRSKSWNSGSANVKPSRWRTTSRQRAGSRGRQRGEYRAQVGGRMATTEKLKLAVELHDAIEDLLPKLDRLNDLVRDDAPSHSFISRAKGGLVRGAASIGVVVARLRYGDRNS